MHLKASVIERVTVRDNGTHQSHNWGQLIAAAIWRDDRLLTPIGEDEGLLNSHGHLALKVKRDGVIETHLGHRAVHEMHLPTGRLSSQCSHCGHPGQAPE